MAGDACISITNGDACFVWRAVKEKRTESERWHAVCCQHLREAVLMRAL